MSTSSKPSSNSKYNSSSGNFSKDDEFDLYSKKDIKMSPEKASPDRARFPPGREAEKSSKSSSSFVLIKGVDLLQNTLKSHKMLKPIQDNGIPMSESEIPD